MVFFSNFVLREITNYLFSQQREYDCVVWEGNLCVPLENIDSYLNCYISRKAAHITKCSLFHYMFES